MYCVVCVCSKIKTLNLALLILYCMSLESDSPCLHPLQVVQEVLQVLADQRVPEYRLFQLGLEVLSLPIICLTVQNHIVSHGKFAIFTYVPVYNL